MRAQQQLRRLNSAVCAPHTAWCAAPRRAEGKKLMFVGGGGSQISRHIDRRKEGGRYTRRLLLQRKISRIACCFVCVCVCLDPDCWVELSCDPIEKKRCGLSVCEKRAFFFACVFFTTASEKAP